MQPTNQLGETSDERRHAARVTFGSRISVCEHVPGTEPDDDAFLPVKASDLSQTGISFTTTRWPLSDRLLVRLRETGDPRQVQARVIDCRREVLETGDSRFAVRCEFEEWR